MRILDLVKDHGWYLVYDSATGSIFAVRDNEIRATETWPEHEELFNAFLVLKAEKKLVRTIPVKRILDNPVWNIFPDGTIYKWQDQPATPAGQ